MVYYMKFQAKVYNVIVKSKLIEVFSERRVDKDIMLEYYNLLEDQNIFSRYIFNVLDVCCTDIKDPFKKFNEVKAESGDFFREIIEAIKEISNIDIDVDVYVDLWLYMILCGADNQAMTLQERGEILSSLSMGKKSDRVELCFQILYLGEYIEILLKEQPVNFELIKQMTAELSKCTQEYNATIY